MFCSSDRVHGGVHAVHQHRGPLGGRHELPGRPPVGVRQPRARRIPRETEAERIGRIVSTNFR